MYDLSIGQKILKNILTIFIHILLYCFYIIRIFRCTMSYKIKILMSIVESYEKNLALGHDKQVILASIISHFMKNALDQNWYETISASFISAMIEGKNPRNWLANQFKEFGIYQASDQFQGKGIAGHHCMSLVFDLLHSKQDAYLSDINKDFNNRAEFYLKQNEAFKITVENLKTGDLILYRNTLKYMHIAVFAGKINGHLYAISKFGAAHNVFIHPLDSVPEHYGNPVCFTHKIKFEPKTFAKFQEIKAELDTHSFPREEKLSSTMNILPQTKAHLEVNIEQKITEEQKAGIFIVRPWLNPPSYNSSMFRMIKKSNNLTSDISRNFAASKKTIQ